MLSDLFQSIRRSKNKNASPIKNLGIPSETYLTLTPLNPMYQSYEYSFTAATQSKAKAAALLRNKNFDQAFQRAVDSSFIPLSSSEVVDLLTEEKAFLKQGKEIMDSLRSIQYKMTKLVIEQEMEAMEVQVGEVDPHPSEEGEKEMEEEDKEGMKKKKKENITSTSPKLHDHRVSEISWWKNTWNQIFPDKGTMALEKLMSALEEENSQLLRLELEFIRAVVEIMGPVSDIYHMNGLLCTVFCLIRNYMFLHRIGPMVFEQPFWEIFRVEMLLWLELYLKVFRNVHFHPF